jgi:hypothetical protein
MFPKLQLFTIPRGLKVIFSFVDLLLQTKSATTLNFSGFIALSNVKYFSCKIDGAEGS